MIPETTDLTTLEEVSYPNYTYKLDLEKKRILGRTDGQDAIRQAIYKMLQTERYAYLIYGYNYGAELDRYIGKDFDYIASGIEGEIKETLYQDSRIINITDFKITRQGLDSCLVSFLVETSYGRISIEQEVGT